MALTKFLEKFTKEKTHREVFINTIGNYLNIAFSVFYVVLIARFLSPADNGVYIVLFTLVYVLTNIFDFGVSATIYSYLPPILSDKAKSYSFLKASLIYQTVLGIVALVIVSLFVNQINNDLLKLHVPIRYFVWSFGAIPFFLAQNFALNTLYASRKFLTANLLINFINIFRLVLLLVFYFSGSLNLELLLIIFGPLGPIVFFLLLFLSHPHVPRQLISAKIDRKNLDLRYSVTFFVATQLYFIASRLDLFIVAHFLTQTQTGYYGLAQKIVFSILTTTNSITQVLSPQFSKATTYEEVRALMRRFALYCLLPVGLLIGAIITPDYVYTLVFSETYSGTMPGIARLLSGVNIFFVIMQTPMLFFLYTIKKPNYVLVSNFILIVVIGVGSLFGINRFGLVGPPIALFASYLIVSIYGYWFFFKELKKL